MTKGYSLYDLHIASELPLPGLLEAGDQRPADVHVRVVRDLPAFADDRMTSLEGGAAFLVPGVASYAIRGGSEIRVQPEPGAARLNVRLYLLGSAMGMLLHQRGVLPLHANAVELGGRAFVFMGPPGAGKSTLAAMFERLGRAVVADDVCAIRVSPAGEPWVSPGLPRLRLWRNSLAAMGLDAEEYPRSYAGDQLYDKFDVPLGRAVQRPVPVGGVFLLQDGAQVSFDRLDGAAAMAALIENIYRGEWAGVAGTLQQHWRTCLAIASAAPVFVLRRPRDLKELPELGARTIGFCRERLAKGAIAEPASEP